MTNVLAHPQKRRWHVCNACQSVVAILHRATTYYTWCGPAFEIVCPISIMALLGAACLLESPLGE